jgi:hypothetical protein
VIVVDEGQLVPGATVVFHESSGAVIASVTTDASGRAKNVLPAGGAITVAHLQSADGEPEVAQLITFVALESTPELRVEIPRFGTPRPQEDLGPIVGQVLVDAPSLPDAHSYEIVLGCTSVTAQALPVTLDIPEACLGNDGLVDVYISAYSVPEISAHLASGFQRGVQVDSEEPVRVAISWHAGDNEVVSVDFSSLPPNVTDAFVLATQKADGMAFPPALVGKLNFASQAGQSLKLELPKGFADSADIIARLHGSLEGATELVAFENPLQPMAVDGSELLPTIAELVFDPISRAVDWRSSGDLSHADGMYISLRSLPLGTSGLARRWLVLAPPDFQPPLILPELPTDLADFSPEAAELATPSPGLAAFEFDWISGPEQFFQLGTIIIDDLCIPTGSSQRGRVTRTGTFDGLRLEELTR